MSTTNARALAVAWTTAMLLVLTASTASARDRPHVQIGSDRIVVTTAGGASAVITRAPFAVRFLDPSGHAVLQEVSSSAPRRRVRFTG